LLYQLHKFTRGVNDREKHNEKENANRKAASIL